MASSVFYYFSCGNNNDVVGWIAAILIFITGVFYIIIGCFCAESFPDGREAEVEGVKEELVT
jgi:hypothetical protein